MKALYVLAIALVFTTVSCGELGLASQKSALCCTEFSGSLRVMSLNLAHGRGNGIHQAAKKRSRIEANLDLVSEVVEREDIDLVGVQEADNASQWSGDFDHVGYLADAAGFGWWTHGGQANVMWLDYGTGMLGNPPLVGSDGVKFQTFGPGFKKGFTLATVVVDGIEIDVVSVHLDPLLKSRREKQVDQLVEFFSIRNRPLILMGDFNVTFARRTGVGRLLDELDLKTERPWADDLDTFGEKRLDWILVSRETLEIETYYVVPDELSDHKAVVAQIAIK